jgi:hypothetical protein
VTFQHDGDLGLHHDIPARRLFYIIRELPSSEIYFDVEEHSVMERETKLVLGSLQTSATQKTPSFLTNFRHGMLQKFPDMFKRDIRNYLTRVEHVDDLFDLRT